jgi:hypothetical protein
LHLALVHKVHRVKPDLKGSKEPQDHLDPQDPQGPQDQKATQDPRALLVKRVHPVQRFE